MGKSLKKNFIFNILYEILILVVPLVTAPYVARVLGAESIGIYNYVTANVTYFSILAAFGSASYAQREIAFYQKEKKVLTNEFWGIFIFRVIITITTLIGFSFFVFINNKYSLYYLISSISIISVATDVSWFFQGLEEFKITITRNFIVKLIMTILIFLVVKDSNDLWLYFVLNVGAVFIGNLTLFGFLKKYIGIFELKNLGLKKHFCGSLKLFVPAIAIQVYTVLDKTMLGSLTNILEVGYYSQAEKIVKVILCVINALSVVLLPRMSSLIAGEKYETANMYYLKAVGVVSLLAIPCSIGGFFIAEDFIPWFFGEEFVSSIPIFKILSVLFVVIGMAKVVGAPLLIPMRREKQYTFAVAVGAIVNVGFNFYLIPQYAAIGASIASVIAEMCVTTLEVYFVKDYFKPKIIFGQAKKYFFVSLPMLTYFLILCSIFPTGRVRMIIMLGGGMIIYFATLCLTHDELWNENIVKPIINRIKYKMN
ncbi:MAG: flippase [Clostridiales bacterium]|nr:flippase [Clostridiales bacterium]